MINHADIENVIGCKTLVTDRMQQAIEGWYDAAEDVVFAKLDFVLNDPVLTADRVAPFLDELARRPHERELIQMVIHEQYFYPDYALYEPDYAQRIWEMARWMHEHGYRSASLSEMTREEDARL